MKGVVEGTIVLCDDRGVYVPTLREIVTKTDQDVLSCSLDDKQIKLLSLFDFIQKIKNAEPLAIDLLHSQKQQASTPEWNMIVEHKNKAYAKDMPEMFNYFRSMVERYGIEGTKLASLKKCLKVCDGIRIKSETIGDYSMFMPVSEFLWFDNTDEDVLYVVCDERFSLLTTFDEFERKVKSMIEQIETDVGIDDNDGVDFNAVSKALKIGYQLKSLYESGEINLTTDQLEFVDRVSCGTIDIAEIRPVFSDLLKEVESLKEQAQLPEHIDCGFWDNLYLSVCSFAWAKNVALVI